VSLHDGGLFVTHMKKKTKTGMSMVALEPEVIEMIDYIGKVEGLTREEVFETMMHCFLADAEAKR
jgi:hypothetical protein